MALRYHGVESDISGDTVEDRCENLLQSMLDAGLGRIVSQDGVEESSKRG